MAEEVATVTPIKGRRTILAVVEMINEITDIYDTTYSDIDSLPSFVRSLFDDIKAITEDDKKALEVVTRGSTLLSGKIDGLECRYNRAAILLFLGRLRELNTIEENLMSDPDMNNVAIRKTLHDALFPDLTRTQRFRPFDQLLINGFSFCPEDARDPQLLYHAVANGYIDVVERLLDFGADVNMITNSETNTTLLHNAARSRRNKVTKLLLKRGAAVNAKDESDNLPVTYAVEALNLQIAKRLLKDLSPYSEEDIRKLFHIAVKDLNIEMIKFLITQTNVDVNARDESGLGTMDFMLSGRCWNARCRTSNAVVALEEPVPDLRSGSGDDTDSEADEEPEIVDHPYDDIIANLASAPHPTLCYKKMRIILALLQHCGLDVNARGNHGRSSLHTIVINRQYPGYPCVELINLLVELGADVNSKDDNDVTALHIAAYVGDYNAVDDLMRLGADLDDKDIDGRTPLHLAAKNGHERVVRYLVFKGADLAATCNANLQPLEYALNSLGLRNTCPVDDVLTGVEVIPQRSLWRLEGMIEELIRMMIILDHQLKPRYRNFIGANRYERFYGFLKDEIETMKKMMIDGTNISFYDVLTATETRLIGYVKEDKFIKAMESDVPATWRDFKWFGILSSRLKRAQERKRLQDIASVALTKCSRRNIDTYVAMEILKYIRNNKDLKRFYEACYLSYD